VPGVTLHTTRDLPHEDRTEVRGIPVTTVARTLVDLADLLDTDRLTRAVNEAEVLRLLDMRALTAALARANGRRGVGRLRVVLAEPSPGSTRSELETRFVALCRRGGLDPPRTNALLDLDGRQVEVDALWTRERLVAELDGAAFHQTRRAFHQDRRRDAGLAAAGYVVVRFTWQSVTQEGDGVIRELRRILEARGGAK